MRTLWKGESWSDHITSLQITLRKSIGLSVHQTVINWLIFEIGASCDVELKCISCPDGQQPYKAGPQAGECPCSLDQCKTKSVKNRLKHFFNFLSLFWLGWRCEGPEKCGYCHNFKKLFQDPDNPEKVFCIQKCPSTTGHFDESKDRCAPCQTKGCKKKIQQNYFWNYNTNLDRWRMFQKLQSMWEMLQCWWQDHEVGWVTVWKPRR